MAKICSSAFIKSLPEYLTSIRGWYRESLPSKLLEQLETYLPEDPVVLVGVQEVCNGVAKMVHTPVWLHMDVMTDNIQMVPYSGDDYVPGVVDLDKITCGRSVKHTCSLHEEMQDGIAGVREPSKSCMVRFMGSTHESNLMDIPCQFFESSCREALCPFIILWMILFLCAIP